MRYLTWSQLPGDQEKKVKMVARNLSITYGMDIEEAVRILSKAISISRGGSDGNNNK